MTFNCKKLKCYDSNSRSKSPARCARPLPLGKPRQGVLEKLSHAGDKPLLAQGASADPFAAVFRSGTPSQSFSRKREESWCYVCALSPIICAPDPLLRSLRFILERTIKCLNMPWKCATTS